MEEPGHGIVGRESDLDRVRSFIGSVSEGPSALLQEGAAGIGKSTLWHAGVSIARARGHRVLACRAAESEARLSYTALGDLFDVELPDLPGPQKRALDAALLRAEFEGAPALSLHRVAIGPLREEAMTRLLRDRTPGGSDAPQLAPAAPDLGRKPALCPSRSLGPSPDGGSGQRPVSHSPFRRISRSYWGRALPRYRRAPLMGSSLWRPQPGPRRIWSSPRNDGTGHRPA
jgi:hypothetical protein